VLLVVQNEVPDRIAPVPCPCVACAAQKFFFDDGALANADSFCVDECDCTGKREPRIAPGQSSLPLRDGNEGTVAIRKVRCL